MAVTLEQLKQKTQNGQGFNAPGAAENLRFLQQMFDRAAKEAAKDASHRSLAVALETHADMMKRLAESDPLKAQGDKEKELNTALTYLIGFNTYLNKKEPWEPDSPLTYLNNVICKNEQEKSKLNDALQSLNDVLELNGPKNVKQEEAKQEKKEEPKEGPQEDNFSTIVGANSEADAEIKDDDSDLGLGQIILNENIIPENDDKDFEILDGRTTPQLYLRDLQRTIDIPPVDLNANTNKNKKLTFEVDEEEDEEEDEKIDQNEIAEKERLLGIIGKKVALKYAKTPFDPKAVDALGTQLANYPYFSNGFTGKSIEDMKKIARGNADKIVNEFRKEAVRIGKQPLEEWWPIVPNARDYVDGIKKKIGTANFLVDNPPYEQVGEYSKILAARASVNAARNTFRGRALDKDMDQKIYTDTLTEMEGGAVEAALFNLINTKGEAVVHSWARTGHGGLLEDKVKEEIRNLATEGRNNFRLGVMPARFRPTIRERLTDIQDTMADKEVWGFMTDPDKRFLISEYVLLQKDAREQGPDAVMGDIKTHNETASAWANSAAFGRSVPNIEEMRNNLMTLDPGNAIQDFKQWQKDPEEKNAAEKENAIDLSKVAEVVEADEFGNGTSKGQANNKKQEKKPVETMIIK